VITLKDFMETVNYRITEVDDYGWKCYGSYAYSFDSWNGDNSQGHSVGIVLDTNTQVVYQMEAHDYSNQRSYRWIKPEFRKSYEDEARAHGVIQNEAYDDVEFIDLETTKDMLSKARSIVLGVDYDARIEVPIELDNDTIAFAALEAHKMDITLNDYIQHILKNMLESENVKRD
jgi:hypothetical protein